MDGKKLTVLLGTAVLVMGILTGCDSTTTETTAAGTVAPAATVEMTAEATVMAGGAKGQAATEAENAPSADLNGTIGAVGSTSMEKFANVLSESFMEKYLNVTMTAEFVGSSAGIETVSNGTADIGNFSRNLKDEEKADGMAENIVTTDRIAVVIGGANTIEGLTKQQLSDIHEGEAANWKDADGNDAPIVMIERESGSGTRSTFEELLKLENVCKYSNELDSTGAVMAKVASAPGAVGYVSLDVLDDTVEAVKLEGAESAKENIRTGSYSLGRPFAMAIEGDMNEQNELVKALFGYIYSDEGAETVRSVGPTMVDK